LRELENLTAAPEFNAGYFHQLHMSAVDHAAGDTWADADQLRILGMLWYPSKKRVRWYNGEKVAA
jgi:hypothetical protein